MSQDAYSPLKAAWHTERIEKMRKGLPVAPAQCHFIISDLCNHDCHFCAYRMSGGFSTELFADEHGNKNPNRMIPKAKAMEILLDLRDTGVSAVQFTGGGEPTVHPDHLDIFKYAQDIGFDTALVTNGYLFRYGWEDVLPKMKWVRVSVDAGNPETYAQVRRLKTSGYSRVLSNISALVMEAPEECVVGVGFVMTLENWREVVDATRQFKDLGVDNVRISGMFSTEGSSYYGSMLDDCRALATEAEELSDVQFKVYNCFSDRMDDLDLGRPDYSRCGYQEMCTYIGADQRIYRCCTTSYTNHGKIGNLTSMRYKDWFREHSRKAFDGFKASSCHTCQFNEKNRAINYLLADDPLHVSFV